MAINTKINWCDHTANLWWGCTKVHEGCLSCYAETLSNRWGRDIWGADRPRLEVKAVWKDLERMQREAAKAEEVHRVFVGSMMDIFEKPMPLMDTKSQEKMGMDTGYLRSLLFQLISAGLYNNLLFLFLTKRPSNINKYIPEAWKAHPPKNVMFGTSVSNQETANTLIPQLLQVEGKKFLSMEPLLGPVDLEAIPAPRVQRLLPDGTISLTKTGYLDWIIVGGESGHGARPMHPEWVRSIRDQCATAGVPFFFKQWGEYWPGEKGHLYRNYTIDFTDGQPMVRTGKKEAGRLLDGHTHDGFPDIHMITHQSNLIN